MRITTIAAALGLAAAQEEPVQSSMKEEAQREVGRWFDALHHEVDKVNRQVEDFKSQVTHAHNQAKAAWEAKVRAAKAEARRLREMIRASKECAVNCRGNLVENVHCIAGCNPFKAEEELDMQAGVCRQKCGTQDIWDGCVIGCKVKQSMCAASCKLDPVCISRCMLNEEEEEELNRHTTHRRPSHHGRTHTTHTTHGRTHTTHTPSHHGRKHTTHTPSHHGRTHTTHRPTHGRHTHGRPTHGKPARGGVDVKVDINVKHEEGKDGEKSTETKFGLETKKGKDGKEETKVNFDFSHKNGGKGEGGKTPAADPLGGMGGGKNPFGGPWEEEEATETQFGVCTTKCFGEPFCMTACKLRQVRCAHTCSKLPAKRKRCMAKCAFKEEEEEEDFMLM